MSGLRGTERPSMTEVPPAPQGAAGEEWHYQLRLDLADDAAQAVQKGAEHPGLGPLRHTLDAHDAELRCQYDAFAGYCAEAEVQGVERYPLYAWTKAVIARPRQEGEVHQVIHHPCRRRRGLRQGEGGRAGSRARAARRRRGGDAARQARHRPRQQPADAGEIPPPLVSRAGPAGTGDAGSLRARPGGRAAGACAGRN